MPAPGAARRHHVVPNFLLSRFALPASSKGVLHALDKHTGRVIASSSANVTVKKDFYVLPDDPELGGYDRDLPEQDFARIEAAAAPIVREIVAGDARLEVFERRATMAMFISTMRARTPREREQFSQSSEVSLNELAREAGADPQRLREYLRKTGEDDSDQAVGAFAVRIKDAWESGDLKILTPPDRSLGTLLEVAAHMTATIDELAWWLVRSAPEQPFVISDCPVAMFDAALRPGRGNAFRSSPIAQTTLPLDPGACLLLDSSDSYFKERGPIDSEEVENINMRTYAWADRWVFAGQPDTLTALHERALADPQLMERIEPRPYFTAP